MNKIVSQTEFEKPIKNDFASLRGQWIEDFARFEAIVSSILAKSQTGFDEWTAPISHRLAALAKVKPNSQISKEAAARFSKLPVECDGIVGIRNAIVHGVMTIGSRNGEAVAMFLNASDFARSMPRYFVMSPSELQASQKLARKITSDLNALMQKPQGRT